MARALWLADVLRAGGLDVIEHPGWQSAGKDSLFNRLDVRVVVCHHTGSPAGSGEFPSLRQIAEVGNAGVSPPLANLMIGRGTGRWGVIGSGISNNAGAGHWLDASSNKHTIGIEAENDGRGEPWSPRIYDAYAHGVALLLDHLGKTTEHVCGHKEWAPDRKIDPTFDMAKFRRDVDWWRLGASPVPPVPPPGTEEYDMLPVMIPTSKAGPRVQAGNRTAFFTVSGSNILGFNGAAIGGDVAWPVNLPGMTNDEASVKGLTFRYRTVPVAAGQHLTGLCYYIPGPGDVDPARITVSSSDGATYTYESV